MVHPCWGLRPGEGQPHTNNNTCRELLATRPKQSRVKIDNFTILDVNDWEYFGELLLSPLLLLRRRRISTRRRYSQSHTEEHPDSPLATGSSSECTEDGPVWRPCISSRPPRFNSPTPDSFASRLPILLLSQLIKPIPNGHGHCHCPATRRDMHSGLYF